MTHSQVLRDVGADLFAVAAYGKILPQAVLDLPRFGALNVHPSLLPLYRGATPLQSQIRDGVRDSGVTIILMDAGMDTGDIVAAGAVSRSGQRKITAACTIASPCSARSCWCAPANTPPPGRLMRTPQRGLASEAEVARTTTRPLRKGEVLISVDSPPSAERRADFVDHIRAFSPDPGARIMLYPFSPAYTTPACRARSRRAVPNLPIEVGHAVIVNGWILIRAADGMARRRPPRRARTSPDDERGVSSRLSVDGTASRSTRVA